jgi:WD40 repeat protein
MDYPPLRRHTLWRSAGVFSRNELDKAIASCYTPVFRFDMGESDDQSASSGGYSSDNISFCIALNRNGNKFVRGTDKGCLELWDLLSASGPTKRVTSEVGHSELVTSVTWSPEEAQKFFYSAALDRTVRVWDSESLRCRATFADHPDWLKSLAVAPTSICDMLISGCISSYIVGRRVETGKTEFRLKLSDCLPPRSRRNIKLNAVNAISFDHDSSLFGSALKDGSIIFHDIRTVSSGQPTALLRAHARSLNIFGFHPSISGLFFSCARDSMCKVWDIRNLAQPIHTMSEHSCSIYSNKAAWLQHSRQIAVGSDDGCVVFYDSISGKKVASRKWHSGSVYMIATATDAPVLISNAISMSSSLLLWSPQGCSSPDVVLSTECGVLSICEALNKLTVAADPAANELPLTDTAATAALNALEKAAEQAVITAHRITIEEIMLLFNERVVNLMHRSSRRSWGTEDDPLSILAEDAVGDYALLRVMHEVTQDFDTSLSDVRRDFRRQRSLSIKVGDFHHRVTQLVQLKVDEYRNRQIHRIEELKNTIQPDDVAQ